jgi:succinate dehydrogenase / fumarate reductase cytochrome b subunit
MNVLLRPLRSSVGAKFVMALTGIGLLLFVVAHMMGNLFIYLGPDAINSYAHALKSNPELLWPARTGLLTIFVIHLVMGIRLNRQNQGARDIPYVYEDTVQATWASRHMLLTGLVLLAFILFHLAHFTFGIVTSYKDPVTGEVTNYLDLRDTKDPERADVYRMVVAGFRSLPVTLAYLVAQFFLWLHLWHGGSSWFQSLGINHPAYNPLIRAFGPVLATIILVGNCSIPLAVLSGVIGTSLY